MWGITRKQEDETENGYFSENGLHAILPVQVLLFQNKTTRLQC